MNPINISLKKCHKDNRYTIAWAHSIWNNLIRIIAFWCLFFRFHPEIAGVFTHSSILSPRSIVLETIRTDLQLNRDKKFPALWMWYGRKDKNWLRWAVHTAECFMDLKIQTNFQVNYAMQGHEIIPDEVNYLKEWVEQIIPNPGRGMAKGTS